MAERSPVDDGFHMPAEWAPHERCWMGWPCRGSLWSEGLEAARTAYAAVAQAIAGFEPVTMPANPHAPDESRPRCRPDRPSQGGARAEPRRARTRTARGTGGG